MTIDCAVNLTDNYILSGSTSGELWCWDLVNAKVTNKLCHMSGKVLNSLSVHPTKNIILTSCVNTIKIWAKPDEVDINPVIA